MLDAVVVIPVYNHPDTIGEVTRQVRAHGVPCILVDDGSSPECAAVLDALAASHAGQISLVRLPTNQGKGAAMVAGFRAAANAGHTHVLQVDADGQHDWGSSAVPGPGALEPGSRGHRLSDLDDSVPRGRLYGRYLTHVWVWINTLSFDIRDSMCGFRLYPLATLIPLLDEVRVGRRMDFDSDVIVRLHWRGVPVLDEPTRVTYPQDGISHFRLWRDNALISAMHARLFLGMLWRAPLLLWRKVSAS